MKMVRVPMGRKGLFVLMAESEARAKGLLPPLSFASLRTGEYAAPPPPPAPVVEVKVMPPVKNKARKRAPLVKAEAE